MGRGCGGAALLVLVWATAAVLAAVAAPTVRRSRRAVIDDSQLVYLMKFGYLPQSDLETGNLRTDEQLRAAIRELQVYGNIAPTGEIDEATRELLARPRCGLPDLDAPRAQRAPGGRRRPRRFALHGRKWDYTNLTWSLQTLYPRNLDPRLVRLQLGRALDVWAQNSKLTFSEVDSKRADILVYFERGYHGDGYPFDGRGQILAHAFFPGDGRGGDAHFDEEENWLLNEVSDESEGTSLFAVAAHEFGHSLGLSHSSMPGALMYPWYQGITPNFQLPDDDRHGIQQLYGSKEDRKKWGPFITSKPHRPPPTTSTTTTTTTTTRKPYVRPTKRRDPPRYTPPPPRYPVHYPTEEEDDKPNGCEMSYDAISVIRGEVFIFKGRYLWRIGNDGLLPNYPAEIRRLWHRLPENLTHVDAVYERNDKKIVFFIGKMYYTFDANTLENRRPLTHLGLPESLQKIDGAMVWGHNKKTYFFSGTMYWRFDEDVGKVELDYPRDMSMWKGVDYNIDTVFQWKDGKTYFFKGKGYWKFNDYRMSVENERQLPSGPKWLGCPLSERSNEHKHYSLGNRGEPEDTNFNTSSSAATRSLHTVAGVILITHIIGFIRILIKFL